MSALPHVTARTRGELRRWLTRNHATSNGAWLVTYKKGASPTFVSYDDIVEELLCFGWVDSRPNAVDAQRSKRLITPRKPSSGWSARNKALVASLIERGLMTPAGQAAIAAAKRNGTWGALDAVESMEMPPDLASALARNAKAKRYFDAFPPSSKKIILTWVTSAKRPETRAARIAETVRLAAQNLRANHWRQPKNA